MHKLIEIHVNGNIDPGPMSSMVHEALKRTMVTRDVEEALKERRQAAGGIEGHLAGIQEVPSLPDSNTGLRPTAVKMPQSSADTGLGQTRQGDSSGQTSAEKKDTSTTQSQKKIENFRALRQRRRLHEKLASTFSEAVKPLPLYELNDLSIFIKTTWTPKHVNYVKELEQAAEAVENATKAVKTQNAKLANIFRDVKDSKTSDSSKHAGTSKKGEESKKDKERTKIGETNSFEEATELAGTWDAKAAEILSDVVDSKSNASTKQTETSKKGKKSKQKGKKTRRFA